MGLWRDIALATRATAVLAVVVATFVCGLSAHAAGYNVVDSNNKSLGPIGADGSVIVILGGQPVSLYVQNTGFYQNQPEFFFTSDNCSTEKFIAATGLINVGTFTGTGIYFGNKAAKDIVANSETYYSENEHKTVCGQLQGGYTVHVALVRFLGSDNLKFTPPFRVVPQ